MRLHGLLRLLIAAAATIRCTIQQQDATAFVSSRVEGRVRTLTTDAAGWLFAGLDPCRIVRFVLADFSRDGTGECPSTDVIRSAVGVGSTLLLATVRADNGLTSLRKLGMRNLTWLPAVELLNNFTWIAEMVIDHAAAVVFAVGVDGWLLKLQWPSLAVLETADLAVPYSDGFHRGWMYPPFQMVLLPGNRMYVLDRDTSRWALHLVTTAPLAVVGSYAPEEPPMCSIIADPGSGVLWGAECGANDAHGNPTAGRTIRFSADTWPPAVLSTGLLVSNSMLPVFAVLDFSSSALYLACAWPGAGVAVVDTRQQLQSPTGPIFLTDEWGESAITAAAHSPEDGTLVIGFQSALITRISISNAVVMDFDKQTKPRLLPGQSFSRMLQLPNEDAVLAISPGPPGSVLKVRSSDGDIVEVLQMASSLGTDYFRTPGIIISAAVHGGTGTLFLGCGTYTSPSPGALRTLFTARTDSLALTGSLRVKDGETAVQTLSVHQREGFVFAGILTESSDLRIAKYRIRDGVRVTETFLGNYVGDLAAAEVDEATGRGWWILARPGGLAPGVFTLNLTTMGSLRILNLPGLSGTVDAFDFRLLGGGAAVWAAATGQMGVVNTTATGGLAAVASVAVSATLWPRSLTVRTSAGTVLVGDNSGALLEKRLPTLSGVAAHYNGDLASPMRAAATSRDGAVAWFSLARAPAGLRAMYLPSVTVAVERNLWPLVPENALTTSVSDVVGGFCLYATGEGAAVRIRLSDLSHTGTVYIGAPQGLATRSGHRYVYFSSFSETVGSTIWSVDLRSWQTVWASPDPPAYSALSVRLLPTMGINIAGSALFVCSADVILTGSRVTAIQLSTLQETVAVNLVGRGQLLFMDDSRQRIVVATIGVADATVRLEAVVASTFNIAGRAVMLPAALSAADVSVVGCSMDAESVYVFCSINNPSASCITVVQVDLRTMSVTNNRTHVFPDRRLFNGIFVHPSLPQLYIPSAITTGWPYIACVHILMLESFQFGNSSCTAVQESTAMLLRVGRDILGGLVIGFSTLKSGADAAITFATVNAEDWTVANTLQLLPAAGESWLRTLAVIAATAGQAGGEETVVAGTYAPPGSLLRVSLTDMQRRDTLTFPPGEERFVASAWDSASQTLFLAGAAPAGVVSRVHVNATHMARVDSFNLRWAHGRALSLMLDLRRQLLYVGASSSPATILLVPTDASARFDCNNWETLQGNETEAACMTLDVAGDFLLVGTGSAPASVVRLRLDTFSRQDALILPYGCDYLRAVALDRATGLSYWGTGTSPGMVVTVNSATLQLVGGPVPLRAGEDGARALLLDASAGFLYVAIDTAAGLVAQLELQSLTRAGTGVLNTDAPAGRPAALAQATGAIVVGTDTSPGALYKLFPTPPTPDVQKIVRSVGFWAPSATLCAQAAGLGPSWAAQDRSCVFGSDQLELHGAIEGSFTSPGRVTAIVKLVAAGHLSADDRRSWVSAAVPMPAVAEVVILGGCSAGSSNLCSLRLPLAVMNAAWAAVGNTTASVVSAALLSVVVARDGVAARTHLLAVLQGAPALLTASPAVLAQHSAAIAVEAALPLRGTELAARYSLFLRTTTDTARPLVSAVTAPCPITHASDDGQTLFCTAPPLDQRLLGRALDVVLTAAGDDAVAPLAVLPGAVTFAWPVLSSVRPTDSLPTIFHAAGSVLLLQSAAFSLQGQPRCPLAVLDATVFRAWVGNSACANVTPSAFSLDTVTCIAPSGVGTGVPVTVEVSGCFNVTSFEVIDSGVVSAYDGQKETAPVATRGRSPSTARYTVPALSALQPTSVLLPAAAPPVQLFTFALQLEAEVPLIDAVAVQLLGIGSAANCSGNTSPSAVSQLTCSVPAEALRLAITGNGSDAAAGVATLSFQLRYVMPGWPAGTSVLHSSSLSVSVYGVPTVLSVQPTSGPAGTVITITGTAFQLPAFEGVPTQAAFVVVGGSMCRNVTVVSAAAITCIVPPFNASSATAVEIASTSPVTVSTTAGASLPSPAAAFTYEQELIIDWASNVSAPNTGHNGEGFPFLGSLVGVAPLQPTPAIRVVLGTPLQCQIAVITVAPQDRDTEGLSSSLVGRISVVPAPGAALISFPDVVVAVPGLYSVNTTLRATCLDNRKMTVAAPRLLSWTVAGPVAVWSLETVNAETKLRGRVIVPSAEATPPVQLLLSSTAVADASTIARLATCRATLTATPNAAGAMTLDLGSWAGAVANETTLSLSNGVAVVFPGLTFAAAPFGSRLQLAAECTWQPTGQTFAPASPVAFSTVSARATWQRAPPGIVESQQPFEPVPRVHLEVQQPPDTDLPLICRMDAAADAAAAYGANVATLAAESLAILQTVTGPWNATLNFDRFVIAGRRQARYNVTVACTLGSQAFLPLSALVQIAGCPPGKQPGGTTGWLCNDCETGAYSDGAACVSCPTTGASCSNGRLLLLQGFYRPPAQAAGILDASAELHPCFNTEACVVNATARQYSCAEPAYAAGSPLCGECGAGYSMFGSVCSRCWPGWASALLLSALLVLAVAGACFLALKHTPGTRSAAAIAFRQLLGFVQMLSVIATFRVDASLRSLLGWTDVSNGSLLSFGPLACTMQLTFVGRYLLTLALPLGFAGLVALLALGFQAWRRRRIPGETADSRVGSTGRSIPSPGEPTTAAKAVQTVNPLQQAAVGSAAVAAAEPVTAASSTLQACAAVSSTMPEAAGSALSQPSFTAIPLRTRVSSILLMLTTLLYMPLLSASLKALDCYERPVAGVTYLREDLRVVCGAGPHAAARVVAALVVVLLTLVLPGALLLLLCRLRGRAGALLLKQRRPRRNSAAPSRASGVWRLHRNSAVLTARQPATGWVTDGADAAKRDITIYSPAPSAPQPDEMGVLQLLRPLYDGYDVQRGLLWYEAAVFARKALLAIVATLISEPSAAAGTATVLLLAATCLQASLHPYEDPRFNRSEAVSLWGASAAAAFATLLGSGAGSPAGSAAIIASIGFVAAAGLAFLVWSWALHVQANVEVHCRNRVRHLRQCSWPTVRGGNAVTADIARHPADRMQRSASRSQATVRRVLQLADRQSVAAGSTQHMADASVADRLTVNPLRAGASLWPAIASAGVRPLAARVPVTRAAHPEDSRRLPQCWRHAERPAGAAPFAVASQPSVSVASVRDHPPAPLRARVLLAPVPALNGSGTRVLGLGRVIQGQPSFAADHDGFPSVTRS